jgi:hypothetical protein
MRCMLTIYSDHALLLLRTVASHKERHRFLFRAFWPKLPGFCEAIMRAWHCLLRSASPFRCLDWLLHNTARVLQSWSEWIVGNIRQQLAVVKEVLRLESAQDTRVLEEHEEDLRRWIKLKALGLTSLQRCLARQESRLLWLHEGDASTKFFHA